MSYKQVHPVLRAVVEGFAIAFGSCLGVLVFVHLVRLAVRFV